MDCLLETVMGAGSLALHLVLNLGGVCVGCGSGAGAPVHPDHIPPLHSVWKAQEFIRGEKKQPI